jgi:hypothetical protein
LPICTGGRSSARLFFPGPSFFFKGNPTYGQCGVRKSLLQSFLLRCTISTARLFSSERFPSFFYAIVAIRRRTIEHWALHRRSRVRCNSPRQLGKAGSSTSRNWTKGDHHARV